jgi:hypothetical protein
VTCSRVLTVAALAIALAVSPAAATSAATADRAAAAARLDSDRGGAASSARAVRTDLARWSTARQWRTGARHGVAV